MAATSSPFRTALEMWTARVTADGDGVGFKHRKGGAWLDLSWREADLIAREMAAGLISLGVEVGDRICLVSQTRLEWFLADLAILMAGGTTVPIYPSSTAEQSSHVVRDAGARAIIVEDAVQLEKVLPLLSGDFRAIHLEGDVVLEKADARGRATIALAEVTAAAPPGAASAILSLEALRSAGRAWQQQHQGLLEARSKTIGPEDIFTIIYTSGTTGAPKGVVLTHMNLMSALDSACRALTIRPSDLQYLWLTLAHVLGREMLWAPVYIGAPTAFAEGLTKLKDNLVEVQPTFMAGVPRIYEKFYAAVQAGMQQGSPVKRGLVRWAMRVGSARARAVREGREPSAALKAQHGIADKLVLSKLRARLGLQRCRFLLSGGAPLAAEIAEFFHAAGILILEGYGLTETMAAAFVNRVDTFKFGTVGRAIDVIEAKIADDGEILLKGPTVFREYYRNPEATREAIDAEGWFHSGDIGHFEESCLRITDRKKDIIVTANGKKIAPQGLENAIKARTSLVSQVMVYGDRRPYCVALVTLTEEAVKRFGGDGAKAAASAEAAAAIQQEIDGLNATLAPFERIRRFLILPVDFSEAAGDLTPSLKVRRKVVTDRNRSLLDGLYAGEAAA